MIPVSTATLLAALTQRRFMIRWRVVTELAHSADAVRERVVSGVLHYLAGGDGLPYFARYRHFDTRWTTVFTAVCVVLLSRRATTSCAILN